MCILSRDISVSIQVDALEELHSTLDKDSLESCNVVDHECHVLDIPFVGFVDSWICGFDQTACLCMLQMHNTSAISGIIITLHLEGGLLSATEPQLPR
jgi:hypothetical protein